MGGVAARRMHSAAGAETEAAIQKTEQDFNSLPLVVDPGLRRRLREGIANLRARSLALCAQPLPQATRLDPPPR